MDPKLLESGIKFENTYNDEYYEIPSYQMQTISSRLKIVDKEVGEEKRLVKKTIPFTVGSAFITHNVKLLQQETLQKLKAFLLSYKNENEINRSNINDLRLLKNDIESSRTESQKLQVFAPRRQQILNTVPSRYKHFIRNKDQMHLRDQEIPMPLRIRRKEKVNMQRDAKKTPELAEFLKLQNRLQTLFKKNTSNINLLSNKAVAHRKPTRYEAEKPDEELVNILRQAIKSRESYTITRDSSLTSINKNSISGRSAKMKKKKRINERYRHDTPKGEPIELEDLNSRIMNQKEKLRMQGEITSLDLATHLNEIQQNMGQNFAPSIYSRKKRRRNVRKYYVPTGATIENIQEQLDVNNETIESKYNYIASDRVESKSSISSKNTITKMERNIEIVESH